MKLRNTLLNVLLLRSAMLLPNVVLYKFYVRIALASLESGHKQNIN